MRIVIDRIEGDFAVVELAAGQTVDVPLGIFPGASEGDIYHISKEEREETDTKNKIQDKFNRLKKGAAHTGNVSM